MAPAMRVPDFVQQDKGQDPQSVAALEILHEWLDHSLL